MRAAVMARGGARAPPDLHRAQPHYTISSTTSKSTAWARSSALMEQLLRYPKKKIGVRAMASWRSLLTTTHSRNLSESRIRAVQCYECPTKQ